MIDLIETVEPKGRQVATRKKSAVSAPVPTSGPMGNALAFLQSGGDLASLEKMMDLQERFDAKQSEKAYNEAFSAFKAEAVRVLKTKGVTDGPLKGKNYAELHSVVDAVTPALSKHGLSASWKLTIDEKDWIEVTCTLKHVQGHCESVSMGGPPDAGGAKNAIQARASTVSYLERYTLKAVCGVAEGGQDDDGGMGKDLASARLQEWTDKANAAVNLLALNETRKMAGAEFNFVKDVAGWNAFKVVVEKRRAELAEGGAQ